jgi:DNA-binding MltR family transcriptional regulator
MPGWYVEGKEEFAAVDELEGASDRASAIVASSLIETRLNQIIHLRLSDEPKILKELFRASGPLGNFSTKIDLALLLGLIGKEAHGDLIVLKKVRNEFAHKLDTITFDTLKIQTLCANFVLIEKMINPMGDETWRPGANFMLQMSGYPECIKSPRGRFLTASRLFVVALHPKMPVYRIDRSVPHI